MNGKTAENCDIVVCVITCMRPAGLSRCLESLMTLQLSELCRMNVEILVVDNDPDGSARQIVENAARASKISIRYEIEPRRGIPFARNRAVDLSRNHQFIAFVDDDETVREDWLNALISTQQQYDADVVAGPVIPMFEPGIPTWLIDGRFFDKRRKRTGSTLHWASTANILIRMRALKDIPNPFDERFAMTGGTDRFLTLQLARTGAQLIWCDEAVVQEVIPASRGNVRWLIRRGYRTGNSIALCERAMDGPIRKSPARICAKAIRQILTHTISIVPASLSGRSSTVHHLIQMATGWGTLLGLLGHRYNEYRTIHGS